MSEAADEERDPDSAAEIAPDIGAEREAADVKATRPISWPNTAGAWSVLIAAATGLGMVRWRVQMTV